MKRVVLISCVKSKLPRPAPARELYTSPLFRLALRYAKTLKPAAIYILSAKHGLVSLEKRIAPYEETLNTKSHAEVKAWSARVLKSLAKRTNLARDEFVFLAGERYRRDLMAHMKHVSVPLEGLGLGKQLQYLKKHV